MTTYKVWNGSAWVYIDSQNYDSRYILNASKGSNSGVASLDESGHIPSEQLPSSIVGAVSYKGVFDPASGAPIPAAQGYYYVANSDGTISATSFATGDWLVYVDETTWNKIENSSSSVTWSNVSNKPASYTPDTHSNSSHSELYITTDGVTFGALNTNGDVGTDSTQVAAGNHTHTGIYQSVDADLTAIAGLVGTSGLLKKTAANTWTLDTNSYLTEASTVSNALMWDSNEFPSDGVALQVLRLNSGGTALEFATVSGSASAFTDLTDVPSAYTDQSGKYVKVNNDATALEFSSIVVDIHSATSTSEFTTGDEVLIYDTSEGANRKILRGNFFSNLDGEYISIHGVVEETTPASAMELLVYDPSVPANRRITRENFFSGFTPSSTFTTLTDTPSSYSGAASQYVRVNSEGTALEFATVASSYTLPTATDTVLGGVKIGSGITITDGVISASGGGGGSELTFASGETAVTLPGTPSIGQIYEYVGTGDIWTITANASQTIRLLNSTGNTLTAEQAYACVGMVYLGDNVWLVRHQIGTISLTEV